MHRANYETAAEYTREQAERIGTLIEQDLAAGTSKEEVLRKFQYMLENSPQRSSQFVCIVEGNNRVIAHPLRSNVNKDVTGWVVETETGTVPYSYPARAGVPVSGTQVRPDGTRDVVFHKPVQGLPWSVCVHVSYRILNEQTKAQLWAAGSLLIPLVVLLVILSSFAARGVARSYEKRLLATNKALESSQEALEEKVHERTSQLAEVNRQLALKVEERDTQLRDNLNFLANISHELRTPLNAVIGYSEIMAMELFGPIANKKYKDYLAHIKTSARHLIEILNDILDLSKLTASNRVLDEEVVNLRGIVDEAASIVGPRAGDKQVNLITKGPDLNVRVDVGALRQVLVNIMSNAAKYSESGAPVHVTWREKNDGLSIQIADQGIGIPADELDSIMLPFQQSSKTSRQTGYGTGLGLPIAKALVTLHGGYLQISSEPGQGTTVTITLPRERIVHENGAVSA